MTFDELVSKAIETFHLWFPDGELQGYLTSDHFGEFNEIADRETPSDRQNLCSIAMSNTMLMTIRPESLADMELESVIELTPLELLRQVVVEQVEKELEDYWKEYRETLKG